LLSSIIIIIRIKAINIPIQADIKNRIPAAIAGNSMEYFRQKPQILYSANNTIICINRLIKNYASRDGIGKKLFTLLP
jgi:hypothetical protein